MKAAQCILSPKLEILYVTVSGKRCILQKIAHKPKRTIKLITKSDHYSKYISLMSHHRYKKSLLSDHRYKKSLMNNPPV